MNSQPQHSAAHSIDHRIARTILLTFILTFIVARVTVLAIMLHWIPTFYLHVAKTHVHHLNYGIFLLSFIGAYVLLIQPSGRSLHAAAVVYAIGLTLTFDEFGMWLHLGGPYWQRASFDAVVVIAALLSLIVFAPSLRSFRPRHWTAAIAILVAIALFGSLLSRSLRYAEQRISPILQDIEAQGPPE
jgi:hypothetical protein